MLTGIYHKQECKSVLCSQISRCGINVQCHISDFSIRDCESATLVLGLEFDLDHRYERINITTSALHFN
jgi:hypothetical protein